jgi:hypothetical protein
VKEVRFCSFRTTSQTRLSDSGYTSARPKYYDSWMAAYLISPGAERGFDIKIVGNDGTRQTMLGFPTREAAEAWIAEDQRRSDEGIHPGFCAPRRLWSSDFAKVLSDPLREDRSKRHRALRTATPW